MIRVTQEDLSTDRLAGSYYRPVKQRLRRVWAMLLTVLWFTGCSSIGQIGTLGPKNLPVYSIRDTGLLSENRMTVILTEDGNVIATIGGTVAGPATVGAGVVSSGLIAGSVAYSAKTLADGLSNIGGTIKLPVRGTVKAEATVTAPQVPAIP